MFLVAFDAIRNAFCHRHGIVVMFALIMTLMAILIAHRPGGGIGAGEPNQRLPWLRLCSSRLGWAAN